MAISRDLASIEKLNNSNYANWLFKIENLLVKDDLFKYVLENPPETPDEAYTQDNVKAKAIINLSIEDGQILNVKQLDTPKQIWDILKAIHLRANLSSKIFLLRKLYSQTL